MNWADSHVEEGGSLVMDWDRLHGAFLSEASENEKVSIDSAPTEARDRVPRTKQRFQEPI